jgi:hypothetical protein|tara:strand:+ start:1054 stop:1182 length:129 start_codon:yes stop_codon:yes gene_type:complete
MTTYILIDDESDDDDDYLEFSNKDDLIAQMASWLNMRVERGD